LDGDPLSRPSLQAYHRLASALRLFYPGKIFQMIQELFVVQTGGNENISRVDGGVSVPHVAIDQDVQIGNDANSK
jgi:hypothetical protein